MIYLCMALYILITDLTETKTTIIIENVLKCHLADNHRICLRLRVDDQGVMTVIIKTRRVRQKAYFAEQIQRCHISLLIPSKCKNCHNTTTLRNYPIIIETYFFKFNR